MLAASRGNFKIGYYSCCEGHAPWGIRRGLVQRNRTAEEIAWRRDVDEAPAPEPCGCQCHAECIAEAEPFCLGCDNSYADLCSNDVPWRPKRPTFWGVPR